jgi:hypothetical protein
MPNGLIILHNISLEIKWYHRKEIKEIDVQKSIVE